MSKLLSNRGYRVTAVNNGDNAIRALEEEDFDVVVLDLKMPGMDGITTLQEIKKLGLFTETLILTGHGSIDTALQAVKLGAYDYLTKPCEIDELVDKIEGAREKKTSRKKKICKKKNEIWARPIRLFRQLDAYKKGPAEVGWLISLVPIWKPLPFGQGQSSVALPSERTKVLGDLLFF